MAKFRTLLFDPPWDHENWSDKGKQKHPSNYYPTMSTESIARLPVAPVAEEDAILLLWSTKPHFEQALGVCRAWGFAYVSFTTWLKMARDAAPRRGTGYHNMACTEPLIIARRGRGVPVRRGDLDVFFHPPGPHSAKPDDQYEIAENYGGPFLEGFARVEHGLFGPRPGWTYLGHGATGRDITEDLRTLAALPQGDLCSFA